MNTRRKCINITAPLTLLVAMAASAPLHAQSGPSDNNRPNSMFQKLDTNNDGFVNRDEAAKLRGFGQVLNKADANHDGKLNEDEFLKAEASYDAARAKAYVSDSAVTARVKAALVKDKDVSALAVSVKTDRGTVLLSGFVDNELQARRAQDIAAAIKGVKSVKSNLVVKS